MPKIKSKTRYVILGLLSEESLSGYQIKRIIDKRLCFFWNESFGQIYPEMHRLEKDGLIRMVSETVSRDKEAKVYAITKQGKRVLDEWIASPVEKETVRFELLLKLYFSNTASASVMAAHIKAFAENHQKQQALFKQFEAQLKQDIDIHSNHRQILMVLSFGQKVWDAYAAWCDEAINLLTNLQKNT